jgi:hypothetical protein
MDGISKRDSCTYDGRQREEPEYEERNEISSVGAAVRNTIMGMSERWPDS